MSVVYTVKASKGDLKAKMFEYFRQVEETGVPLIVTDHGEPTLIIHPYQKQSTVQDLFADVRGKLSGDESLFESENDSWGELA